MQQYADLGYVEFLRRYAPPAIKGFLRGQSYEEIRSNIPFEVEGEARQRALEMELETQFGENPCEGTPSEGDRCIF